MSIDDEDFTPRLGRMRSAGKSPRTYLSRILQAANLARGAGRGGSVGGSRFTGARLGRGSGAGRLLHTRDRFAFARTRRVVVKARLVRLGGKGGAGARAHLRYLQRDGTNPEGARGVLYGPDGETDGKAFLERGAEDRHQFRFIVSAEDGALYEDLKPLTRRLMTQMEEDLGTKLDWVAVDHHNTGHPHSHILLHGKDDQGRDLVIARDYLAHGLRERAAEIVSLDLGPRSDREIEERLRAEVTQERLTGIDRTLLREAGPDRIVGPSGRDALEQAIRAGRLQTLGRLGLAEPTGDGRWRLSDELSETLTRIGERDDIIRTMQRAMTACGLARAPADQVIYDPTAPAARPVVGRVVERGLADEHADRHYLIIDATDGRSHYVAIGGADRTEPLAPHAIIRIEPRPAEIRDVDRTVATIAAANGGRYDIDAHLRHDPNASEAFAETHVRRLEAIRRASGGVERQADGSWTIAPDHLGRVAAYEAGRLRDQPVALTVLSTQPLARLDRADAVTWLDRNLIEGPAADHRDAGFGREVRAAEQRRRIWLIEQGLAEEKESVTRYRPRMLAELQRRELVRVAAQLSGDLGLAYREAKPGDTISGSLSRRIDLTSGRFAVIERAKDFTLVPWRPSLGRQIGRPVSGVLRDGGWTWSARRGRSGPAL